MEEIEIPDYVNAMPSFFWWELDEFIVLSMFVVIGYVMRGLWPFAGLLVGIFIAKKVKKWKRGELDGALTHILFQSGLLSLNKLYRNAKHGILWV